MSLLTGRYGYADVEFIFPDCRVSGRRNEHRSINLFVVPVVKDQEHKWTRVILFFIIVITLYPLSHTSIHFLLLFRPIVQLAVVSAKGTINTLNNYCRVTQSSKKKTRLRHGSSNQLGFNEVLWLIIFLKIYCAIKLCHSLCQSYVSMIQSSREWENRVSEPRNNVPYAYVQVAEPCRGRSFDEEVGCYYDWYWSDTG